MKKILITGGNGYLGCNLVKYFFNFDYQVFAIIHSNSENLKKLKENFKDKLQILECDLLNEKQTIDLFSQCNPDCVIHLAGKKSIIESEQSKELYLKNNLLITKNVLAGMKNSQTKQIIFASSTSVYGSTKKVAKEDDALLPLSPYSISKVECETLIKNFCSQNKITYSILRYSNLIGGDKEYALGDVFIGEKSFLIPTIVGYSILGEKISLRGGNLNTKDRTAERDYISITDACRATHLAEQKKKTGIFNICSGKTYSVLQIVKIVEKIVGHKLDYAFSPMRNNIEATTSNFSNEKAKNEFNFVPTEKIETAIENEYYILKGQLKNYDREIKI